MNITEIHSGTYTTSDGGTFTSLTDAQDNALKLVRQFVAEQAATLVGDADENAEFVRRLTCDHPACMHISEGLAERAAIADKSSTWYEAPDGSQHARRGLAEEHIMDRLKQDLIARLALSDGALPKGAVSAILSLVGTPKKAMEVLQILQGYLDPDMGDQKA